MAHIFRLLWLIFATGTAMVGHQIHHSLFWSVVDFLFSGLAWAKWLICHEVTLSIIKSAFSFFFN